MRRLRLAILLLVPAAVLLTGCGDSYQVAASVGDLEISHDDLETEAAAWGSNAELMLQLDISAAPADGAVPQLIVNEILNLHIQGELARLATADIADQGDGPAQMSELRAGIESNFGPLFADFPDDLREQIYEDITHLQFLSTVGGVPADADVYVSPRYGTTDINNVVQSPTGARPDPTPVFGL
ncbi:hypothetical protein [Actinospongicola halichondriae]|uniref:hypothetical protein n=1 Tax=Actinospongicola halichondriae TaxID=3236844 RepID=UPI003D3F12DC